MLHSMAVAFAFIGAKAAGERASVQDLDGQDLMAARMPRCDTSDGTAKVGTI